MHGCIADVLNGDPAIAAATATLDDPEHGVGETDVLTWWGHKAHGAVSDVVVERVAERGWQGMGPIIVHSGHFSKIFKKLMGTRRATKIQRVFDLCLEAGDRGSGGVRVDQ
jgi:trehalose utilization protein